MRVNFLLITVVLATAVVATAVTYAQPTGTQPSGKIGGTGVGINNPANAGSAVGTNPGAGANASVDNEQTQSAPVTRDPGSAIGLTIPFGPDPKLGTPPSEEARQR